MSTSDCGKDEPDVEKRIGCTPHISEEIDSGGIVRQRHGKLPTFLLAQKHPKPIPSSREPLPDPITNLLSYLTFSWIGSLIHTGYARVLDFNDLWTQSESRKVKNFVAIYNTKKVEYARNGSCSPHLKAIAYAIRWKFVTLVIVFAIFSAGEMGMAVIARPTTAIITEVYLGDLGKRGRACAFVAGNFLENFGFTFSFIWYQYYVRYYSDTLRSVLIACIYEKVVRLSPRGRAQYPGNKITALVTADTNRIYMASRWTVALVAFVPMFGALTGILVDNIGVSALPGLGLVVIGIASNVFLSRFIANYRKKSIPFADKRIGSVRDTIENMRIIKYYGWEESFLKLISGQRKQEASLLEKIGRVSGCIDAITTSVPLFAGMLAFALLSILGGTLTPSRVFPSLTLFTIFIPASMFFSQGINSSADAWPSVLRLEAFFNADEDGDYIEPLENSSDNSIQITGATFVWDSNIPVAAQLSFKARIARFVGSPLKGFKKSKSHVDIIVSPPASINNEVVQEHEEGDAFSGFKNINLDIKRNELVMLVGTIGSGKTSLLSSIAGEMCKTDGHIYIDGKVTPVMSNWSLNATIRENILFGKEYDAAKYSEVVHVCSLESDFSAFAGRDFAEIGERGITLSGGQKARLSLARGVYNAGDIILLDDVLSAVDSKVGKQIFDKCITGYLKNTTRIMATHNLKLLPLADKIVFLDGSGAVHSGTLDELLKSNPKFKETYTKEYKQQTEEAKKEVHEPNFDIPSSKQVYELSRIPTIEHLEPQISKPPPGLHGLISEETSRQGSMNKIAIKSYLKSGSAIGAYFLLVIFLIQTALAAAGVMEPVWLNFWSANKFLQSKGWYIGFYGLILSLRTILYIVMVVSVASFCYTSSSKLHNAALENVYRAPMSYFDSTPLGRIISRFTDDVANLDSVMFMQLRMVLYMLSSLVGAVVVVLVYIPYAALALIPAIVGIWVFMSYFRCSSRELKRINSVCRSRMFTHITETISGLSTIVGYHRSSYFRGILQDSIDDLNMSMNVMVSSQLWLSLRIVLCALPIGLVVSFLCVFRVFHLDASTVGLLLSLVPEVVFSLAFGIPSVTELENQMNSVERLDELAHEIPQEAPYSIPETKPRESWPDLGGIVFRGASLRYRPSLPLALVNCNLDIRGGTKVGIVGRTGAGKSTMLSSLFRITELWSGSIEIDGVDISTIGLGELRSKLSIIPQDPVLFEGTIRFNLDPFGLHTDLELWDTLRRCGAVSEAAAVSAFHKFHLDAQVNSAGTNFSLGERQLLTLARALVRKPKVIVLDEATANVDLETDMMIQGTISREFAGCTIMCIAHRLETILHYNVVVVMDQGKVIEQGSPRDLWELGGAFRSMCDEANLSEREILV